MFIGCHYHLLYKKLNLQVYRGQCMSCLFTIIQIVSFEFHVYMSTVGLPGCETVLVCHYHNSHYHNVTDIESLLW